MLDNELIKNNWPKIKSHVLSHWDRLSAGDVEKTHGNVNSLGKLVEEAYGDKEDFDTQYDRLCKSIIRPAPSSYRSTDPRKHSDKKTMHSAADPETEMADKFMDKDRDENYLMGPNGVTRKADTEVMKDLTNKSVDDSGFSAENIDGFHNADRYASVFDGDPGHKLEEEILKPDLKGMEATDAQTTPMRNYSHSQEKQKKHKEKTNIKSASDEFKPNHVPRREDFTKRGSNSSANTTSPSALTPSEALSKDMKKL